MIGWGVSFWGLTSLLETAPTAVRRIIALSIGSWFIFDSLGSLLAGAPLNVVFNVGYLLLFAVPLRRLGAVLDTGTTTEPTRNPVVA